MENYIYELYKKGGIRELEDKIENIGDKLLKASVTLRPSQRELLIVITDRRFHFIKAYEATDFDCKPVEQCYLSYGYDKLPKSDKGYCDDATFRRFYLRFMKNEFETYYEDYKTHQLELVDKDLDCNQTV